VENAGVENAGADNMDKNAGVGKPYGKPNRYYTCTLRDP